MRQVLSVSLPAIDVRQIKLLSTKRGYASVSSYIQYLLKEDSDLISEAELVESVKAARKEYRAGKSKKAQSLTDLI